MGKRWILRNKYSLPTYWLIILAMSILNYEPHKLLSSQGFYFHLCLYLNKALQHTLLKSPQNIKRKAPAQLSKGVCFSPLRPDLAPQFIIETLGCPSKTAFFPLFLLMKPYFAQLFIRSNTKNGFSSTEYSTEFQFH